MRRISGYYTDCPVCKKEVEVLGFKIISHGESLRLNPFGRDVQNAYEFVRCLGSGQEVEHSKITPVRL